jgi:hypothetical protein
MKCNFNSSSDCNGKAVQFAIVHTLIPTNNEFMIAFCEQHKYHINIFSGTEVTEEEAKVWEILEK